MLALDLGTIRSSFINASRKEVTDLALPADFESLAWDRLDYFGWRDPRMPRRAYLVVPQQHGHAAVLLKQAEVAPRTRAQCSWCQDVTLPNDVLLYTARRAGPAGRNGNTVGTLICADFQCSSNVRKLPPMAYIGFDVEAARDLRIETLQVRAAAFVEGVR